MSTKSNLMKRILRKKAVIGIIGTDKETALRRALSFADAGFKTLDFLTDNIQASRINSVYNNSSIIASSIFESDENDYWLRKNFQATIDRSQIKEVDVIVLCLPHQANHSSYLSFIKTLEKFLPFLRKGQLILLDNALKTEQIKSKLISKIQNSGLSIGKNLFLMPLSSHKKDICKKYFLFPEKDSRLNYAY